MVEQREKSHLRHRQQLVESLCDGQPPRSRAPGELEVSDLLQRFEQLQEENRVLSRELDARHQESEAHLEAIARLRRKVAKLRRGRTQAESRISRVKTKLHLIQHSWTWRTRQSLVDVAHRMSDLVKPRPQNARPTVEPVQESATVPTRSVTPTSGRTGMLLAKVWQVVFLGQRFWHALRTLGLRQALARTRRYLTNRSQQNVPSPSAINKVPGSLLKDIHTHLAKTALDAFLTLAATLRFPCCDRPVVSVIIILYNRAELTLTCLRSLLADQRIPFEVILVDNASTDRTREMLSRIEGVRTILNKSNKGFGCAVNQAAAIARGRYLLLLNNDTQVLGNSLEVASQYLDAHDDVGAVGGRIVLLDGTLQEAGSVVYRDGSTAGLGRGADPYAPAYMFRRDVDYCSGAFLMTPTRLFLDKGGFDKKYYPAYYEDVDYCVRLWQDGKRVVYDPGVTLLHYEYGSSSSSTSGELMRQKKATFIHLHGTWLAGQSMPAASGAVPLARVRDSRKRILFIEDRVPHAWLGSGYPRARHILHKLIELGHNVTLYPLQFPKESWADIYESIPCETEVALNRGNRGLAGFLAERRNYYDMILVSRPHNMRVLRSVLAVSPGILGSAKVLYDSEALFALREIKRSEIVEHQSAELHDVEQQVVKEVHLADNVAGVIAVSDAEAEHFRSRGVSPVFTLGHSLRLRPSATPFVARHGMLFVGPVHEWTTPNAHSILWLLEEVLPRIRRLAGSNLEMTFAGQWCDAKLPKTLDLSGVRMLGRVDDLNPLYEQARLFAAPTRFAAGIPFKVHDAAATGLPVVASTLLAEQLGWQPGEELLVSDDPDRFAELCYRLHEDPQLWQRLREGSLRAIERDCSPEKFDRRLDSILRQTL
jgi:O-antigen biosynthesis protein